MTVTPILKNTTFEHGSLVSRLRMRQLYLHHNENGRKYGDASGPGDPTNILKRPNTCQDHDSYCGQERPPDSASSVV